jgi:hypothetical protein
MREESQGEEALNFHMECWNTRYGGRHCDSADVVCAVSGNAAAETLSLV